MIRFFRYLLRCGPMRGLSMLPVVVIPDLWNIRPSTCRRVIGCSTTDLFMARIISVSSLPSYMPLPSAGIRDCTPRPSTATPIMPSSGSPSASARPNLNVPPRQNLSIRLLPVPKPGYKLTTFAIPSSNGRPRSGVRCLPTSVGNKHSILSRYPNGGRRQSGCCRTDDC